MKSVDEKIDELCEEANNCIDYVFSEEQEIDEETREKIHKKYEILRKIGMLVYINWKQNETIMFEGETLLRKKG